MAIERAVLRLSVESVRRLRLRGQGLAPRTKLDPAAVCRLLAGVQAQEPAAGGLAIRARSSAATRAQVHRAWAEDRSIVQTWTLRGTLHFHASEDLTWLLPALGGPIVARSRKRRLQLGIDDAIHAQALPRLRAALTHGPATRAEIAAALGHVGVDPRGQAIPHLLHRAALEGVVVRGPLRGHKETCVLLDDWLPDLKYASEGEAIAMLVRRFFDAYGPASTVDLASWSGLPVSAIRAGFETVREDLVQVETAGVRAWLPRSREGEVTEVQCEPAINLLGRFDTYLISYATRSIADPDGHVRRLTAGGGIIHPAILLDGVVRGTWRAEGGSPPVRVTWFDEQDEAIARAAAEEIASVEEWLWSGR